MKPILLSIFVVVAAASVFYFLPKSKSDALTVGMVVPVQNVALDDIVAGFKSEIATAFPHRTVDIMLQNAAGDINLQKSIFNKFINERVDLLVPIGKSATLMGISLAPKDQSILFLASFIPPQSDTAQQHPKLMGIIDEIPVEMQLTFMRKALPDLKKIAIVFVSSDKVFDDVNEFSKQALEFGITVQKLMVQNLAELYTITSRIEADNQAILTLKDVMVASGINALVQQANRLKIPLITSDEGTIESGGAFAIGVTEAEIGRQGARLAADFIEGRKFERIQYLDKISVFINKTACESQGVDVNAVKAAAESLKLTVVEG